MAQKLSCTKISFAALVLFGALFFTGRRAHAYPSFISHGYTSCAVCHYNAFGNGPLTDYGRALSAVEIAAKPFWWKSASDDDLAAASGFLGSTPIPAWIRPSANYRGLIYASKAGSTTDTNYITMQADLGLVLKSEDDKWLTSASLSYYPGQTQDDSFRVISREHYLRYRASESLEVYGGMMDRIYGLRIPDHIAFSRTQTLTSQNDQTHGVALHLSGKTFETGLHAFLGNLYQDSKVRLKGFSTMTELEPAEKIRVGGSLAYMKNDFRTIIPVAAHLRLGLPHTSSLLTELGLVHADIKGGSSSLGQYAFIQGGSRVVSGLDVFWTVDYSTDEVFKPAPRLLRTGPGLQYYPAQRIELRLDIQALKIFASSSAIRWDLMSQLHLWF